MSKKLGLALLFVGAYTILLGGLFFLMAFYGDSHPVKPDDWEWIEGVGAAIVICIGAVLACKKYAAGYVGIGIAAAGAVLTAVVMVYGIVKFNFLSPLFAIGEGLTIAGIVVTLIFHIINTAKAKKYGESLL